MVETTKLTRGRLATLIREEISFLLEKGEEEEVRAAATDQLLKMRKEKGEEEGEGAASGGEGGEGEEDEGEMELEFEPDPEEKPSKEEKPGEEEKKEEKPRRSLKKLKQGDVNTALNQLRNKGIGAETFRKSVVKAVKDIYRKAGPERSNFAKKDTPTIKMISNEVIKILKGDFSNLVNESRKPFLMVHPITYAVIKLLAEHKKPIQISIKRNKE